MIPFAVLAVVTLGTVLAVVSARDFAKAVDDDPHQAPDGDWPAVPTFRDTTITDLPRTGGPAFPSGVPGRHHVPAAGGDLVSFHGEAM